MRSRLMLLCCVALAALAAPPAHAGTAGTDLPWNRPLDVVVGNLTGPTGKLLAIAAIAIVGLAWAFGRSDEGLSTGGKALIGIGCLLGAPALIDLLGFEGAVLSGADPDPFTGWVVGAALAATAAYALVRWARGARNGGTVASRESS